MRGRVCSVSSVLVFITYAYLNMYIRREINKLNPILNVTLSYGLLSQSFVLKFNERTGKVLHLEHISVWC
jgi:hypothetical protein